MLILHMGPKIVAALDSDVAECAFKTGASMDRPHVAAEVGLLVCCSAGGFVAACTADEGGKTAIEHVRFAGRGG
jgi:hypothetical protein